MGKKPSAKDCLLCDFINVKFPKWQTMTESGLVTAGGRVFAEAPGNMWSDGNVLYLDFTNSSMTAYVCQNSTNCTLEIGEFCCT